jgi:hypothetical protein
MRRPSLPRERPGEQHSSDKMRSTVSFPQVTGNVLDCRHGMVSLSHFPV